MRLSIRTRLFLILFGAGMLGVVSILLIDLSALMVLIPARPGTEAPTITPALKILSLIQPMVILAAAVLIGVMLASKVDLSSPVAEALATRGEAVRVLKPQIVPGVVGGLIGGACIILISLLFRPLLQPETIDRVSRLGRILPIPTRLLYGGVTEELLLRWGFMTLVVWVFWRLLQKNRTTPTTICFVAAILVSSFVFGVGHLPIAFALLPEVTVAVVLFVILANSAFGVVAGFLYWKKGLESAIVAHMLTHVVLLGASYA